MHYEKSTIIASLLFFIFFTKSLFLAFYVIPLWDIQDETGHYSYAQDIGMGKGIELPGVARIAPNILQNLHGKEIAEPETQLNWIYQHPPAFHIAAGLVWKITSLFSEDANTLFRSTRIVAAFSGSLTLLVLFKLMQLLRLSGGKSIAILGFVFYLPMYSTMSSGTSHDTTVILFSSLAIFYWVKLLCVLVPICHLG